MSLEQIGVLLDAEAPERHLVLEAHVADLDRRMAEMQRSREMTHARAELSRPRRRQLPRLPQGRAGPHRRRRLDHRPGIALYRTSAPGAWLRPRSHRVACHLLGGRQCSSVVSLSRCARSSPSWRPPSSRSPRLPPRPPGRRTSPSVTPTPPASAPAPTSPTARRASAPTYAYPKLLAAQKGYALTFKACSGRHDPDGHLHPAQRADVDDALRDDLGRRQRRRVRRRAHRVRDAVLGRRLRRAPSTAPRPTSTAPSRAG